VSLIRPELRDGIDELELARYSPPIFEILRRTEAAPTGDVLSLRRAIAWQSQEFGGPVAAPGRDPIADLLLGQLLGLEVAPPILSFKNN
jgi:hypothetical protein